MVKRCILLAVATLFFSFQVFVNSASAGFFDFFSFPKFGNSATSSSSSSRTEIPEAVRTLPKNAEGDTVVVSGKNYKNGKQEFRNVCSQCHLEGITKTDFNVGLDMETLALAYPPRNNIASLIDYMKNPTSYDGEVDISELHPSKESEDIFREMRNLTEDDLYDIATFILIEPKVNFKWGQGKTIR